MLVLILPVAVLCILSCACSAAAIVFNSGWWFVPAYALVVLASVIALGL